VATGVRAGERRLPCTGAGLLAGELARTDVRVRTGVLVTTSHVVRKAERARLSRTGAAAVDMEAGPLMLAAAEAGLPVAVVRAIVDTPDRPLLSPATITGGLAARRSLRHVGPTLVRWARAVAPLHEPNVTPSRSTSSEEGGAS